MQIKTKFKIGIAINVLFLILYGLTAFITADRMYGFNHTNNEAHKVIELISNLDIITIDYLLYHSDRAQKQWVLLAKEIKIRLYNMHTDVDEVTRKKNQLIHDYDIIEKNFYSLSAIIDSPGNMELKEQLTTELYLKSQSMINNTFRLIRENAVYIEKMGTRLMYINVSSFLILFSIITGFLYTTIKTIIKPIDNLQNDLTIIGTGNFDYKIVSKRKDEIGMLAFIINRMASNLKLVTAGRDELNQEIHERLKLEEKMNRTMKELLRTNAELRQFAYVASHDLQSPLRSIAGFLQLLENKYNDVLDDKAHMYIYRSVNAAKRMQKLIEDLLYFSQLTFDYNTLTFCDLNEIIVEVIDEYALDGSCIIINSHLPKIIAQKEQMKILFLNLIENGLKFKKEDGKPELSIFFFDNQSSWNFAVKDNGIGIEKEYQKKIFEIFTRLNSQHRFEGTGIGLAICKKIVELHEGKIWVDSKINMGTTFHVTIKKYKQGGSMTA